MTLGLNLDDKFVGVIFPLISNIVCVLSVLREGVKGELFPEPDGHSKGSEYISLYILTQVIIHTLTNPKNNTSSIVHPGLATLEELIFRIALAVR